MDLVWDLPTPWSWLFLAGVLVVLGGLIFRYSFQAYHRRYFTDKALQLAALRTLGWLVLFGGSFALIFWLVSLWLPAGWLRYVVGAGLWWVLSSTLLAAGMHVLDRVLLNL